MISSILGPTEKGPALGSLTLLLIAITGIFMHQIALSTTPYYRGNFMAKIALLPSDVNSRGKYLGNRELPNNYMGDFTLMGFVVDRYHEALTVLTQSRFRLDSQEEGSDISIDTPLDLEEIKNLLSANNIRCDYSDIADTLYQA
jgi:hypothetical protein